MDGSFGGSGPPDEALPVATASTERTVTKLGGGVKLAPGSLPNDPRVIADERG